MSERGIPLAREAAPAGCGVQGCLIAAVALFVILLVALVFIAIIRFSSPPQPRYGTMEPSPALLATRGGEVVHPSVTWYA